LPPVFSVSVSSRVAPKSREAAKPLDLTGVPRKAQALVGHTVAALGPEWQATVFVNHTILHKEHRNCRHGQPLISSR